jgi:hypothetical protein
LKTRLFICKHVKNRGKVLREITNDFNEGGVVRVHPKTIQRYLHKNKIFRRVVRKKMVVREAYLGNVQKGSSRQLKTM